MSWHTEQKTTDDIAHDKVQRIIEGESIAIEKDEWPAIRHAMMMKYFREKDDRIGSMILELDEKFKEGNR